MVEGMDKVVENIALVMLSISAVWALMFYRKRYRIQNLVSVFRRFSENAKFVEIFTCCDALYSLRHSDALNEVAEKLKSFDASRKYQYLALLEEVAVYAKNDAVVQKDALHLFQYHFHYIYNCPDIVAAFWWNIGGEADGHEPSKKGWRYQSDFARVCKDSIGQ